MFKRDEIIILLGAGASVDADIPDSARMIDKIENLVSGEGNSDWRNYRSLYNFVKSSILYTDGLEGSFGQDVSFNVERLVDVLEELEGRERHPLSPFVAAWNPRLTNVAGQESEKLRDFKHKIINELRRKWVALSKNEQASYFKGLARFQREFQHPLRVFSLNYDLCVEVACGYENVQRGFAHRSWDWRSFEETMDDPMPIFLYKLHGSLDWQIQNDGRVTYVDSTSTIEDDAVAIIFGTSYKLQYIDPFLFLAYEFRRWTLDLAKVIICIGYGFNDEHINGILRQSLKQENNRILVAIVGPIDDKDEIRRVKRNISTSLHVEENRIQVIGKGEKDYLENDFGISSLREILPGEDNDQMPF